MGGVTPYETFPYKAGRGSVRSSPVALAPGPTLRTNLEDQPWVTPLGWHRWLAIELFDQQLIGQFGIDPSPCPLHDLPDEETLELLLAGPVFL